MRSASITALVLLLAVCAGGARAGDGSGARAGPPAAAPPARAPVPDGRPLSLEWILLDDDPARVASNIRAAARRGVHGIHLSHRLVDNIEEVLGANGEARAAVLRAAIRLAHEHGLRVAIWGRELSGLAGRRFCYDPAGTDLAARRDAWRRGLARLPGVDAVVLGFGSAPRPPWRTVCTCGWCLRHHPLGFPLASPRLGDRLALVAGAVADVVVREAGLGLVFRTFVHAPRELAWHTDARRQLDAPFAAMHKSEVPDWQPYHPSDPTLGVAPGRGVLLELDAAGEFQGRSILPFAAPGYFRYRLRPLRRLPAVGAAVRIERGPDSALGTPNEVNLDAIAALLRDPDTPLEDIWTGFLSRRYGLPPGTAEQRTVQRILSHTFEIQLHSRYALGLWAFGKSSDLPRSDGLGQLWARGRLPRWDPRWRAEWRRLVNPDVQVVRWLWQEGSEAVARAWEDERAFAAVAPRLRPADARDLTRRLRHQRLAAEAWRAVKLFVWARRAAPERRTAFQERACRRRGGCVRAPLRAWARWAWEELGRIEQEMRAAGLEQAGVADARAVARFRAGVAARVPSVPPAAPTGLSLAPLALAPSGPGRAKITVRVSDPARVVIRYGLDAATLDEAVDLGTIRAGEAVPTELEGLLAGRRYLVRAEAYRDGEHLRGALHWLFTP